ncbi:MAG: ABC transporter substrate-binding protein [Patescibacteria group bacterium]|nr:ABC transporter substrate-binding protein [Patescibacteria group bacterium]
MGLLKSKILPLLAMVRKFFADSLFFIGKIFGPRRPKVIMINANLDKKLVYSLSKSKIPSLRQLKHLGKTLHKREIWLINLLIIFIVLNLGWLGFNAAQKHLRVMPVAGGQYAEGLIGSPAHINPLYATLSDVDDDLGHLIYSALFKYDGNGQLENDLAESYQVSADGKAYTIKLRSDARWQDGEKITADDVVSTFEDIANPAYNSPLRFGLAGVDATRQDDQTVVFTLSENYAPFLGLLTFGIMPQSVWGQVAPESAPVAEPNLKPIGSGPYQFKSLVKDKSGNIKSYTLTANKNYYGRKPYLKEIVFKFYADAAEALNALNDNSVDGLSYLSNTDRENLIAKNTLNFYQLDQPQLKAIFFNQDKNSLLKDAKVRQALSYATPKQQIIDQVEGGNARIVNGPILDDNYAYNPNIQKYDFDLARAASVLDAAGWKKDIVTDEMIKALETKKASTTKPSLTDIEKSELALGAGTWLYQEPASKTATTKTKTTTPAVRNYLIINLSISADEENAKIAQIVKDSWEKIGAKVAITPVPAKEIQASVVKPKNYEVLLFSEQVGNDPDVYVFWHSTQAGAGGLNLANYKNEEVDKSLEEGRLSLDRNQRIADYQQFQTLLTNDAPAVFLFSPYYNYVQNKKIKGFAVKSIASPADRFSDVFNWYVKTGERLEW